MGYKALEIWTPQKKKHAFKEKGKYRDDNKIQNFFSKAL